MLRVHFIVGCTACGKGAVGRELARRLGGQIVSVDSMKVYRRMDIGTAKPSPAARAQIPHHCIDLVEPWEPFSVAQFVAAADAAIAGQKGTFSFFQQGKGECPLLSGPRCHGLTSAEDREIGDTTLFTAGNGVASPISVSPISLAVGGTSLYIKALSEGLFEGPPADAELRAELQLRGRSEGWPALHAELAKADPPAAARIHPNDEKRITRALEVLRLTGEPISRLQSQWDTGRRRYDCVFIGLRREKEDLAHRINLRVKRMAERGLAGEVEALLAHPRGLSAQAAQAVGYAEMIEHLRGRLTFEEAVERIKINTRQLAKKQRTWHRRFEGVQWFDIAPDEAEGMTADRILAAGAFEQEGRASRDAGDTRDKRE
jgi:tRNA dimethylallyltransferase